MIESVTNVFRFIMCRKLQGSLKSSPYKANSALQALTFIISEHGLLEILYYFM